MATRKKRRKKTGHKKGHKKHAGGNVKAQLTSVIKTLHSVKSKV